MLCHAHRAIQDESLTAEKKRNQLLSYANLGYIYSKLNLWDLALSYYETAISQDEKFELPLKVYLNAACVYAVHSKLTRALVCFGIAFEKDPQRKIDPSYYIIAGNLSSEIGLQEGAYRFYQIAINTEPLGLHLFDPDVYLNATHAAQSQSQWEEASTYYEIARKKFNLTKRTK